MRILPTRSLRAAVAALGLTGLFAVAAQAHHYRLESATSPAPFLRDGRADVVIEPSGVAPLGDGRRVLVADDQAAALHVVDVATGTARRRAARLVEVVPDDQGRPELAGHGRRLRGELLPGRLAQRQD